mmetsp:Transcript_10961/g.16365  ORF Transcript_10961/g.16365 Transcript_10961/m.16365 type:complete len:109 (-) Transcript_10961:19-345(-)
MVQRLSPQLLLRKYTGSSPVSTNTHTHTHTYFRERKHVHSNNAYSDHLLRNLSNVLFRQVCIKKHTRNDFEFSNETFICSCLWFGSLSFFFCCLLLNMFLVVCVCVCV